MNKPDIRTLSTIISELAENETVEFRPSKARYALRIQVRKGSNPVYELERYISFSELDHSNLDLLAVSLDQMLDRIRTDSERK